jgi:hypothetical protein
VTDAAGADLIVQSVRRRGVRVRCPLGGYAPCIDDLCHGGGQTICGLYVDEEVCPHGWIPETCPDGCADDDQEELEPDDDR